MDEAIIKKIMPHSIDSEKAVIGSMIMDADAIVAASEMLTGDDFYQRQFGRKACRCSDASGTPEDERRP